jgi:hypothetical protein
MKTIGATEEVIIHLALRNRWLTSLVRIRRRNHLADFVNVK